MTPAMEHGGHRGRHSPDWSGSPVRNRHSSPHRRNSPRRRSPATRKSSPDRVRSPPRVSHSQKNKSPVKEKVPDRARSPRNGRTRSPIQSGSLSPRSKRLRRAQAEREAEKLADKEHRRSSGKEDYDRGRPRERDEMSDASHNRKSVRDKIDGNSSRSSKHDISISPERPSNRRRHNAGSPSRASKPAAHDEARERPRDAENVRGDDDDSMAKMKAAEEALNEKEKQKPSFELSGKLAEETNKVRGVTLLFTEPSDARKPDIRWRLYVFKSGEVLNEPLYVHRQSCYLFGRERRVADIPTDHPSCSKQHAVIQYRLVEKEQPDGLMSKQVRPYLMDLGSTNGTFINENRIEPQRYYELFEKDTIKFGNSSREYVLLHENSTS